MAYNLPPPWDPGFALPGNVRDEGLQRRAFVTKQMPRGSYYQSDVGDGGYVLPQYVQDEGYGQGTFTTKWAPSGTYVGPKIPHFLNERPQTVAQKPLPGGGQAVTIQRVLSGLGGVSGTEAALPEPFETYGQRAATTLMTHMSRLPPTQRKAALKKTLDVIDPSLWKRTAEITRRYNNQGMPAAQALHQGLARALSTGIAAEIITTGASRSAPQARSLLGLGCYGCGPALALGADDPGCRTPPPAGYTWVDDASGGHWEAYSAYTQTRAQRAAGQAGTPNPPARGAPCTISTGPVIDPTIATTRDHVESTTPFGSSASRVSVSPYENFADPIYFSKNIDLSKVRDFNDGQPDYVFVTEDYDPARMRDLLKINGWDKMPLMPFSQLPQSWRNWMRDSMLKPGPEKNLSTTHHSSTDPNRLTGEGHVPSKKWDLSFDKMMTALGLTDGATVYGNSHGLPDAKVTWPIDKSTVGLYWGGGRLKPLPPEAGKTDNNWYLDRNGIQTAWLDDPDNPPIVWIRLSKIPDQSFEYEAREFFAKLIEAVVEAVKDLGNLACDLLQSPAAPIAGGAVAVVVGAPPQVGTTGVAVAKQSCGGAPPPPVVAPVTHFPFLPVAIAGGVALGAYLLTRPRKKK